jgi:parvulin-like peptidyl-prolyl isomerase
MQKKLISLIITLTLSSTFLFGQTLVTVNGHAITTDIIPPGYEKLDENQRANLMEQLIKEEVLYADLLKSSLVKSDKFKKAFQEQKKLAQEAYRKKTGKNLNKEQIRNIKGAIAVALFQQEEFKKTKVSRSELKDFYNNNPEAFNFPDSIEIADIILPTKAEADKLLKSLQGVSNLDEAFIKAANEHKQNGYMGWFGRGNAPENLFNKAYKYKKRRLLNAPVKTEHGYNVVYLLNKKPAGTLSFEKAKPKIEQIIKQQKVMKKLQDKVESLYGSSEIVY